MASIRRAGFTTSRSTERPGPGLVWRFTPGGRQPQSREARLAFALGAATVGVGNVAVPAADLAALVLEAPKAPRREIRRADVGLPRIRRPDRAFVVVEAGSLRSAGRNGHLRRRRGDVLAPSRDERLE